MASRFILPFADIGKGITPSSGAKLFFFATGTSTPKDTFSDSTALTPNTNPVIADSNGVFSDIFITGTYKVTLQDKNGSQIWEADPVNEVALAQGGTPVKSIDILSDAIVDAGLIDGDSLNIKERTSANGGGAMWDVVPSGTYAVGSAIFDVFDHSTLPLQIKLRVGAIANAREFGAVGDSVTDDTAALKAAFLFGNVFIPSGNYICSDTLTVLDASTVEGEGLGDWVPTIENREKVQAKTQLLFVGTGTKDHSILGTSDNNTRGGKITNPSPQDSNDGFYRLTDWSAGGSPRPFSCAVRFENNSSNISLKNLRIVPNFNGIAGYNDTATLGLGDDWDVGLWLDEQLDAVIEDVQVVGYWRLAGTLQSNGSDVGTQSDYANGERNHHVRVLYQGQCGLSIRSLDLYEIVSSGSGFIDVTNTANSVFLFKTSGVIIAGLNIFSFNTFTLNSVTNNGGTLRLNITGDATSIDGGLVIPYQHGFGMSGTSLMDSEITGLDHASHTRATELGFDRPSRCMEVSGLSLRGMSIINTKLTTVDDVTFYLNQAADVMFGTNSGLESKADKNGLVGVRQLATQYTERLDLGPIVSNSSVIDTRPQTDNPAPNKFNGAGDTGLLLPNTFLFPRLMTDFDNGNSFIKGAQGRSAGIQALDDSIILSYSNPNDELVLLSKTGTRRLTVDEKPLRVNNTIGIGKAYDLNNISDDDFAVIDLESIPVFSGQLIISSSSSANGGGVFFFRAVSANSMTSIVSSATYQAGNGPLNGTTGNDGFITVSASDDNKIYVENRTGSQTRITVSILHGQT